MNLRTKPVAKQTAKAIETLFESAPNGVAAVDRNGVLLLVNTALAQLFGRTREDLIGQNVESLAAPSDRFSYAGLHAQLHAPENHGRVREALLGSRTDGTEFPFDLVLTPFKDDKAGTSLMIVIDTTEQKRAAEQQHLLVGELHHRTQNIFAVIQAVANRSLAGDRSLDEAKHVFLNRLHALARTYTMLTEEAWQGAEVGKLVRDELAAFSERADIEGPAIIIQPSAAQTFTLIFHELATNALKYGSLSEAAGQVTIRWGLRRSQEGEVFSFSWEERGGPLVRTPTRKGYGQTILEDAARHLGTPVISYERGGLRYRLDAPLQSIGRRPDMDRI